MPTSSFAAGAKALIFILCSAKAASGAESAPLLFRSGPAQVALIELFTSEGCSSCPPAEKWLGELRQEKGLWRDFVPVAFHVNYWDHLGWRDALAAKAFTDREHNYAASWGSSSVYTPCFVRNGEEWRPTGRITAAQSQAGDAGVLTLMWQPVGNRAQIEYRPAARAKTVPRLEACVALLGGGIVNRIQRGENSGRELRHEFVALQLRTASLQRDESGSWSAAVELPPRSDIAATRRAVAAWVFPAGQHAPLQAVGGWVAEGSQIEPAASPTR